MVDIGQVAGYCYVAIGKGHPEVLLIPVVTNVASGIYESGRSMYRNAWQRIVDKSEAKSLESTI